MTQQEKILRILAIGLEKEITEKQNKLKEVQQRVKELQQKRCLHKKAMVVTNEALCASYRYCPECDLYL